MRLIIAGSRTLWDYKAVDDILAALNFPVSEVVCGMAPGADMVGYAWAHVNGVPVKEFPADWNKHGKKAGYLRNYEMAKHADALLLLWDGASKGSANMRAIAVERGLHVQVIKKTSLGYELESFAAYP